ncbi:MAG TPA: DUF4287 domain-containing protein [Caulobacteraceae bacterium]|nr:DUF4287 domain-containing protein [Caulobacteraceae bacterium]
MALKTATSGGNELTERQKKWFASVRASLERDTGRTLEEWVAIARTCPETTPRKRSDWMREHHGLGVNRAAQILSEAFPSTGWDDPAELRKALWTDPAALAILAAVEARVAALPEVVAGQRKGFSAWSRKVQFAALKPVKGGTAVLGLAVEPDADPRLLAPKNEGWSERLKAKLPLAAPAEVDDSVAGLLKAAWERS